MSPTPHESVARLAELLNLPEAEIDYLNGLPPGECSALADRVEAAIEERRNVIVQALEDAGRHLPGPLRRKLTSRIQGD